MHYLGCFLVKQLDSNNIRNIHGIPITNNQVIRSCCDGESLFIHGRGRDLVRAWVEVQHLGLGDLCQSINKETSGRVDEIGGDAVSTHVTRSEDVVAAHIHILDSGIDRPLCRQVRRGRIGCTVNRAYICQPEARDIYILYRGIDSPLCREVRRRRVGAAVDIHDTADVT